MLIPEYKLMRDLWSSLHDPIAINETAFHEKWDIVIQLKLFKNHFNDTYTEHFC